MVKLEKVEIFFNLRIYGFFNSDDIITFFSIPPYKIKNTTDGKTLVIYQEKLNNENINDLNLAFSNFFKSNILYKDEILKLSYIHEVFFLIAIYSSDYSFGFRISKENIDLLSKFGIGLDIDYYNIEL